MLIVLLTGLLLVGFSAAFGARAVAFGRLRALDQLRAIEMYGVQRGDSGDVGEVPRALDAVAERVGTRAARAFSRIDLARTRRELLSAGAYTLTAEAYHGYRILGGAALLPLFLVAATKIPPALGVLWIIAAVLMIWRLPGILLHRRAASRNGQIDRELPELIDLLIVSVEAGVGLGAAQQLIAAKLEGPLGSELRLMLQEQNMGLSSDQTLSNLLERCDTPSVWSFVRSLQQGERLGMSIGTILRNLAVEMRTRRRQEAEERAHKAPVKMLFPLVFLIFPAMFIVLMGPALYGLKGVFGG